MALPLFLVGHNWILNCGNVESIGEQDGEAVVSTRINKNRLPPVCSLLGSHLTSFICYFIFIIKVFIGILGGSFGIQFLAICFIDFSKERNQI